MDSENKIAQIPIDDIIPNRFQPRLIFKDRDLNELAESIKIHGIIQPLVLRKLNEKYEIIAGERRYKASQIAGLKSVPAIIIEADDNKSAELAVIENLQRKDLTAIEEAKSFKKLLDRGYANQEELAKKLGVSQSAISNKIRLLNLTEEAQEALLNNRISERHARSLLTIKDEKDQIYMLNKIINNRLTVKQTDKEINELLNKENLNTNNIVQSTPIENISDFLTLNSEKNKDIIDFNSISKADEITEEEQNANNEIEEEQQKNVLENNFDLSALLKLEPKSNDAQKKEVIKPILTEEVSENIKLVKDNEIFKSKTNNIEENNTQQPVENQINPFQESINDYVDIPKNNEPKKDISDIINKARNSIKEIESSGFKVDTEEYDFEDMYQIVIKIEK